MSELDPQVAQTGDHANRSLNANRARPQLCEFRCASALGQECPQSCSNFLTVSDKAIPKSTLSQHFKILREAGLIRSERHGVEMHNISRCTELEQRFPGLGRQVEDSMAVAIDGEIYQDAYAAELNPDSEIVLIPKIGGG